MGAQQPDSVQQRQMLAHDFHRPTYHFVPPANWMNDPNGVIQWDGQYHLFYQHQPKNAAFGLIHWGHAVSRDMIHWADLPIALTPTPDSPDENGCWSGCCVDNGGVPTIVYTAARGEHFQHQTQCIATSDNTLLRWEKYAGNPVLSDVPAEAKQNHDFRDPYVWREGKTWYLALASRIVDVGGVVFLYRSSDLIRWEYLHPLLTGNSEETGSYWECPSFFPLGDKWVLIVGGSGGIQPTVFYFIGDYANQRFTPEAQGAVDYAYFYAAYSMQDAQNRRLLWGWLREGRSNDAHLAAGWAGAQAIPRELSIRGGRLQMEPVAELQRIRESETVLTAMQLSDEGVTLDVQGLALDITADFTPTGITGIAAACSPDGSEQTQIVYDPESKMLSVKREQSSTASGNETFPSGNETFPNEAPHALEPGETLQLRILLDGSVLEVIANGRTSICSRIYPSRAESRGIRLFGQSIVNTMSIWTMGSIWEAR